MVLIDAVVLAGGRSSRLGSEPKSTLQLGGRTLLERTVAAVGKLRIVVVGEVSGQALPAAVLVCREEPPFGGPAAGVAAGLERLEHGANAASEFVIVLACDMPGVSDVVPLLLGALEENTEAGAVAGAVADGVIAVDSAGQLQPLAAVYRRNALLAAVENHRHAGSLDGLSMFRLIGGLELREVEVPDRAVADVDTWDDAAGWGIRHPQNDGESNAREQKMNTPATNGPDDERAREDEVLRDWCRRVAAAAGVPELEVDVKTVLALAGRAAHAVIRPAAPLTTFIIGYAAGVAAGSGTASAKDAFSAAADAGFELCRDVAATAKPHD